MWPALPLSYRLECTSDLLVEETGVYKVMQKRVHSEGFRYVTKHKLPQINQCPKGEDLTQLWSIIHSYLSVLDWKRCQGERKGSQLPIFDRMTQTWKVSMARGKTSFFRQSVSRACGQNLRDSGSLRLFLSRGFEVLGKT